MNCAATSMVMRALVKRLHTDKDSYGGRQPYWEVVNDAMPCFVWSSSIKVAQDAKVSVVEVIGGIFHADADILPGDQVVKIVDKRGRDVVATQMFVDSATLKTGIHGRGFKSVIFKRNS